MTPNSILLMSGAITNDDMRMHAHTPIRQDSQRICVCVCVCVIVSVYGMLCVGARRHVQGYIGQTSEATTSPELKYQAKCQSLPRRNPSDQ